MTLSAYKYRFYPNSEQAEILAHTFGCVRFVYNNILAFSQEQCIQGNRRQLSVNGRVHHVQVSTTVI